LLWRSFPKPFEVNLAWSERASQSSFQTIPKGNGSRRRRSWNESESGCSQFGMGFQFKNFQFLFPPIPFFIHLLIPSKSHGSYADSIYQNYLLMSSGMKWCQERFSESWLSLLDSVKVHFLRSSSPTPGYCVGARKREIVNSWNWNSSWYTARPLDC